jgi:hypothetical protein
LKDADVRKAESAAALERDADGRPARRLHGGQGGGNGGRSEICWFSTPSTKTCR